MARKPARTSKRLTREQKKLIWKPSAANAGAGWEAKYENTLDPRRFEYGQSFRDIE